GVSESLLNERLQTLGCNPEMKAPRSGKISSLSLRYLKHSQRAERLLKKRGGIQRRKSTFLLWAVSAQPDK
ncbi:hypothetical protein J1785_02515, partial [Rahnella sp. SL6]|uniref:hypothetical protein n=1 Tax=Rahnella perminowiae TaxID=2816244 RepID=UPI001C272AD9